MAKIKIEQNFYSPLKVGLLIVAIVFFLFTLHGLLTLEWIGEWEGFEASTSFWIFIADISSAFGLIVRFIGSLVAAITIVYYFIKKGLSTPTTLKLLRIILAMEAIYWFTFITSGIWGFTPIVDALVAGTTLSPYEQSFVIATGIPCFFEAIALPIVLFKVIHNLSPKKPKNEAIKWGLITGTCYVFVWWLNNAGMWIYAITFRGTEYLTFYPQNLISFVFTVFGLLALGVFAAYFTKKSIGIEKLEMLKLKTIGVIIVVAGFYFLWNYLNWIFFGNPEIWGGGWYAWFLGHNLDLWMMIAPLFGLPLLFERKAS